jgi:hypothetical protein
MKLLTPQQLAEIKERADKDKSCKMLMKAEQDRRALLAHVEALEARLEDALAEASSLREEIRSLERYNP